MDDKLSIIFTGIFATLVIDLWALILKFGFKQPTTDWGLAGRWFAYVPRGVLIHKPISKTEPVHNEKLIGWSAHYIIGILYAWMYIVLVTSIFSMQPTLVSAIMFGVATVLAPWFILQPGLGMGVFAHNTPNPGIKRLISLSVHTIFGAALYVGWKTIRSILEV